jgi:hypothetical protein
LPIVFGPFGRAPLLAFFFVFLEPEHPAAVPTSTAPAALIVVRNPRREHGLADWIIGETLAKSTELAGVCGS